MREGDGKIKLHSLNDLTNCGKPFANFWLNLCKNSSKNKICFCSTLIFWIVLTAIRVSSILFTQGIK